MDQNAFGDQAFMPGFHHSVAVLPLPFRRSAVVKLSLFCRKLRNKISFRYSRKRQKAAVTVLPLK